MPYIGQKCNKTFDPTKLDSAQYIVFKLQRNKNILAQNQPEDMLNPNYNRFVV
jgi:hypothetical protein